MFIERAAAIPLITHDPYFSIWCGSDRPTDKDPIHWSGLPQALRGRLHAGGRTYAFLGDPKGLPVLPVFSINVTALSTEYIYTFGDRKLSVRFTSPLIPSDLVLLSRPVSYIDCSLSGEDPADDIEIEFQLGRSIVSTDNSLIIGHNGSVPEMPMIHPVTNETVYTAAYRYAVMGRADQKPLGYSGDNHTVDFGYAYLASAGDRACLRFDAENSRILYREPLRGETHLAVAYDDLVSINYFGEWVRAYWTKTYGTIQKAIGAAIADREIILSLCRKQDAKVEQDARAACPGDDYALLCIFAFRHTLAAHKLIENSEGELAFLSKENDSNGCIGTVDVSYPSTPLLLLENPDLVKGLMNPVFRFASCPVWEFDFAPHDVGRYPYAWGQVYGVNPAHRDLAWTHHQGGVYPPFYQYPSGLDVYSLRGQMPVEECGNMLIMAAACCLKDGSAAYALPHMKTLRKWTGYLVTYGEDPGEQLCTDDFAGHLAHNVNLSAKAIMGVEAFAQILSLAGEKQEAENYHEIAQKMAKSLEKRSFAGDHYSLVYPSSAGDTAYKDTWSLKYNMIWDRLFESRLFDPSIFEIETDTYVKKANPYGTPLDNRSTYTKSDWILWSAALTDSREKRHSLIRPVARFLQETPSRYPFSDWYFTDTGLYRAFKGRSVQGGIFMPVLTDQSLFSINS
ncbi:MAG: DUF4965 domain-containing protein [Firmicutes bacterium]|nr:DUF4965 domain-containing protein [Bacillota bacterium]